MDSQTSLETKHENEKPKLLDERSPNYSILKRLNSKTGSFYLEKRLRKPVPCSYCKDPSIMQLSYVETTKIEDPKSNHDLIYLELDSYYMNIKLCTLCKFQFMPGGFYVNYVLNASQSLDPECEIRIGILRYYTASNEEFVDKIHKRQARDRAADNLVEIIIL